MITNYEKDIYICSVFMIKIYAAMWKGDSFVILYRYWKV